LTDKTTKATRRGVLAGAAGVGAAVVAVGGTSSADTTTAQTGPEGSSPAIESRPIARKSEIPVGGGKVIVGPTSTVVVTQPRRGVFMCFSGICTHLGCAVGGVSHGTIRCPCHGSQFSASNGTVTRGPADRGLARKKIVIRGGAIYLA
jgi:Rieske Fe-S protein